mgnify:FL=1
MCHLLPLKSDICNGFTPDVHTAPGCDPTHQTERRDAPGNPACYGATWGAVQTPGSVHKSAAAPQWSVSDHARRPCRSRSAHGLLCASRHAWQQQLPAGIILRTAATLRHSPDLFCPVPNCQRVHGRGEVGRPLWQGWVASSVSFVQARPQRTRTYQDVLYE